MRYLFIIYLCTYFGVIACVRRGCPTLLCVDPHLMSSVIRDQEVWVPSHLLPHLMSSVIRDREVWVPSHLLPQAARLQVCFDSSCAVKCCGELRNSFVDAGIRLESHGNPCRPDIKRFLPLTVHCVIILVLSTSYVNVRGVVGLSVKHE